MSDKSTGGEGFDPSEFTGEIHDKKEVLKEQLVKLADTSQRNGFTITTREVAKIVLHRKSNEEVVLSLLAEKDGINVWTEDLDHRYMPEDMAFHKEVMDMFAKENPEFSTQ